MTTAQPTPRRGRTVLGPLSSSLALGLVLAGLAAVVTGMPGVAGALVGTVLVASVFALGAVALGVVALVSPSASLLVALLTYTLQVLLVGMAYVALESSGLLGTAVDRRWLSAAVIVATLAWTTAQIVATVRARQPLYDLASHETEASVR